MNNENIKDIELENVSGGGILDPEYCMGYAPTGLYAAANVSGGLLDPEYDLHCSTLKER